MLTAIHPKLPMRDFRITKAFYLDLGFSQLGDPDFEPYLMLKKDAIELHFFLFPELNPLDNYGQVYIRVNHIEQLNQEFIDKGLRFADLGKLAVKPWGQIECSILDPDHNLLTFGQAIE
ncbi:MAG: bleomycin resistance family protein [Bacteroidetes bacterium 43-16]|nr:MAG: bleomycin resistance family protein [Bacteroidetes bacterium 43-16]